MQETPLFIQRLHAGVFRGRNSTCFCGTSVAHSCARILWKMGTVLTAKLVSLRYLGLSGLMTIPIWSPCLALDNLVRLQFKLARDSDIARNGIS